MRRNYEEPIITHIITRSGNIITTSGQIPVKVTVQEEQKEEEKGTNWGTIWE